MSNLITKFTNTDIKHLEEELADHALQNRFDTQATAKLTKWEELVSFLTESFNCFTTNDIQNAATHRAVCAKKGHFQTPNLKGNPLTFTRHPYTEEEGHPCELERGSYCSYATGN